MEYNKLYSNKFDSENYIEVLKKKKIENLMNNIDFDTYKTNSPDIFDNLEEKLNELNSKIEFCKKYQNQLNGNISDNIKDTVNMIEQAILNLDKNIIEKGQIGTSKKNNHIQLEFYL